MWSSRASSPRWQSCSDREDWLADPRFATPDARRAHFDAMKGALAVELVRRDAADWEASHERGGDSLRHGPPGR